MYLSNSLTYDLSALDLWNLGEMTCGFVVFCVPASLVVFSRLRTSTIFSTLKSWFSSFSSKLGSEKSKGDPSWPSSALVESNAKGDYRQINKTGPSPRATNNGDIASVSHPLELQQLQPASDEVAILRTVDFTTWEGYGENHTADEQYGRQHPWTYKLQEQPHV